MPTRRCRSVHPADLFSARVPRHRSSAEIAVRDISCNRAASRAADGPRPAEPGARCRRYRRRSTTPPRSFPFACRPCLANIDRATGETNRVVATGGPMDVNALREAAIEAANRALYEKHGFVPSEDSDEWEDEYRRQFAALKQRYGGELQTAQRPIAAANKQPLPELSGTPEQLRWAASIRDERLREIPSEAVRAFWAQTWTRAKVWVDTRDVPTATLLQRLKPQFDEYRKKQA